MMTLSSGMNGFLLRHLHPKSRFLGKYADPKKSDITIEVPDGGLTDVIIELK